MSGTSPFLQALQATNSGRPPIWIMRQAGRYLPEYRALRERHSFLDMCHTPELAAEVTELPLRLLGFDAAILFSDILVLWEAFGIPVHFVDGKGPLMGWKPERPEELDFLPVPDVQHTLHYVSKAIRILKNEIKVPLIGFAGAPFTLASYLIEGQSSKDLKKTKLWMVREPEKLHRLLNRLAQAVIEYLHLQIDAGVDAIQIFDSWAHVLADEQFREFSLKYMEQILEGIRARNIPVILFCRGSSVFAPLLASIRPHAISLDWQADMTAIRRQLGPKITLQGNMDPDLLYADLPVVRQETLRFLNKMKDDPAYIFNLGHGIHPDTPVDAVKTVIDQIKNFR